MWAPSGPGPAGWDRRRVGARLRAALAGLQELQGLRATQQARVRGALGLHQAPGPRGQELRLEAALAALREQLSRLRRQDAGLKTHLDQLDQQISELQLDVSRSPCEALDSDSRPSSGFYELSDAGSCSLSTSCASVCSDRLSPSLGSWLPALQPSKSRSGMGDWRPRSADETTVPAWSPQRTEDSRLLHGTEDTGRLRGMFRPRPVSTGDLERVLPADTGLQSAGTDASSLLCQGIEIPAHALDPKYQRDLVARGGQEVYPYPSPLHAVALQSPLFALPKEAPCFDIYSPPEEPPLVPADQNGTQPEPEPTRELGSAEAYIHRLLRLRGQELPQREVGQEQGGDAAAFPQKSCGQRSDGMGQLEKPACGVDWGGMKPSRGAAKDSLRQQGPVSLVGTEALSSPLKEETIPWNPCVRGDNTVGSSPSSQIQQPYTDCGQGPVLSPSRVLGPESPPLAPGPFAYTSSTTNETSPLRLRMGSPQNKAMKVKRRVSEKVPRLGKQLPPQPEKQRGIHAAWSTELDPSSRPQQGGLNRRPTLAREPPGRSCSESTLYPVPLLVPLVVTQRESYPASSQALFPMEAALLSSAARRKQRRWQSTMEISAKSRSVSRPGPNLGPPKSPAKRTGGPRAQSRPSLARQDACARSESDPSEHSAECASLFHSTIAETSEDEEASDHTANRFGDESSSNDSEDCAQSNRRGLAIGSAEAAQGGWAWPPVPLQQFSRAPGGTRPSLPPVPKLCRIKASKALKKKIRRFQPAALKVMTMV